MKMKMSGKANDEKNDENSYSRSFSDGPRHDQDRAAAWNREQREESSRRNMFPAGSSTRAARFSSFQEGPGPLEVAMNSTASFERNDLHLVWLRATVSSIFADDPSPPHSLSSSRSNNNWVLGSQENQSGMVMMDDRSTPVSRREHEDQGSGQDVATRSRNQRMTQSGRHGHLLDVIDTVQRIMSDDCWEEGGLSTSSTANEGHEDYCDSDFAANSTSRDTDGDTTHRQLNLFDPQ